MKYFNPNTKRTYDSRLNKPEDIPEDAVTVSKERYVELQNCLYFNAETGCFHDPNFDHNIPSSAIEITKVKYEEMRQLQRNGKAFTTRAGEIIPIDRPPTTQSLERIRDNALNSLEYDFGDGRILITRPQDSISIRDAIDVMITHEIPVVNWPMKDNTKADVTLNELTTVLAAGQLAAFNILHNYKPKE